MMADLEAGPGALDKALLEGSPEEVVASLRRLPIGLVGKTTCAFSLEALSTLTAAAANVGGADAITVIWVDKLPSGQAIWDALKTQFNQKTVPYILVGGEFLGGCDEIKKLQASGALAPKIYGAAEQHGLASSPIPKDSAGDSNEVAAGGNGHSKAGVEGPLIPDQAFVDPHCQPALGDASRPAYPCLFWFPEVVDSNAVRFTAAQVVVICILGIIWRTRTWAHYMILGLALDNLARFLFGPGPSPLAQLARVGSAFFMPQFQPGVPKQFAAACAFFMSVVATVFLFTTGFDPQKILPSCFLGMYAGLAFLEASINFCMGCVMFGWLVKFGILPPEVYAVGIVTKPEAEYTYAEAVKRLDLPEPKPVRLGYPGKPPSAIDVRYKTKLNDHDRQSFNILKHVKIQQFSIVLGLFGLAVMWRAAAMPSIGGAAGFAISNTPGDVLTIIAVVVYGLMGLLYCAKAFFYPRKICKEWMCPLRSNSFVIPPASLALLAFATAGRFTNATTLAKVLFWIGAPVTLALALYLCARWVTDPHSSEHLNPAWLLPPTACFVCALVAPFLDPVHYTEAAYLWFAFGVATGIPLYVITFQRSLLFNEPDDRNRLLKWTWVAAPAVACAAQVALNAATTAIPANAAAAMASVLPFTFVSRLLYLLALTLALMLALLFLTSHASRLKFDISSWALAFPLEALAIATVLYAAAIPGVLTNGMAYAALAVPSVAVATLALHTLHALLMGGVFVMDPKYGPLSQQILTHEAFRVAGQRLKEAVAALSLGKSCAVSAPALADFALQFRRYRLAHAWHAHQEETVIFKEFESYAPGLCKRQHEEHERDEETMAYWGSLIQDMEGSDAGAGAKAMAVLKAEIPAFVDKFEEHLVGEEEHLQRGGRKHMNIDLQRQMLRQIWDSTPVEVWAEFLPWVVANLPTHAQRVKFVRCWAVWALPERAQLIGRMIALGVEAAVWERLVASVPEIVPRGACGWRRYF